MTTVSAQLLARRLPSLGRQDLWLDRSHIRLRLRLSPRYLAWSHLPFLRKLTATIVFSIRFCANHEGTVKASNFGPHVNVGVILDFSLALANMKTQMKKVKVVIKKQRSRSGRDQIRYGSLFAAYCKFSYYWTVPLILDH
jgi:hypothetical protein